MFKRDLDRSTTHPTFDPARVQTHDLHMTETPALNHLAISDVIQSAQTVLSSYYKPFINQYRKHKGLQLVQSFDH